MYANGVLGESGALRCCWDKGELGERPDSAWRMRAPGWMGEGPYLAAALSPVNKYLTFQTYLEGGEAPKASFPPPPVLIGLALPGWEQADRPGWAVQREAAARGHTATPQGEVLVAGSLWKNCLLPTPCRPPCPGANHFQPRRLSLYPSSGDAL